MRRDRGSAFVLVLFVLLVLNIVFLALITESRRDKPDAHQFLNDSQAFYLAQSALTLAETRLRGHIASVPASTAAAVAVVPPGGPRAAVDDIQEKVSLEVGSYSYNVQSIPAGDGVVRYFVQARGEAPLNSARFRSRHLITAVYEQGGGMPFRRIFWRNDDFRLRDRRHLPPPQ